MILKLTELDGSTVIIPLNSVAIHESGTESLVCSLMDVSLTLRVKETIAEIEQQIKEGGICVSN